MHSEQKRSFQSMTPEQKLRISLKLYDTALKFKFAGLRKQHPDWSEAKIRKKVREIFLYART